MRILNYLIAILLISTTSYASPINGGPIGGGPSIGGGGGAPTDAQYWVSATDGILTNEVVINSPASLETAAGLGLYASDILGCNTLAALMVLINGGDYSPTADVDLSGASSVTSGPLAWTSSASLPSSPTDGQFTYYTGGTFDVMGFYNSDTWRYFLPFSSFPDTSGQVPTYNGSGGFTWSVPVVSDIEVSDMAGSAVETSSEGLTDTDMAFATSAAVKDYVDAASSASGYVSAPTYSDDPCTAGQYAIDASHLYYCIATDTWDYQEVIGSNLVWAGWSNLTPVTFVSAEMTTGTSLDVTLSGATVNTTDGTWTLTGSTNGVSNPTYSSSLGSVLIFTTSTTYDSTDVLTLTYAGDGSWSPPISGFTSQSVTNNITGDTYADILTYAAFENTGTLSKPSGQTATTTTLVFVTSPILAGTYAAEYNSSIYNKIEWSNTADANFDRVDGRVGIWITTPATIADDETYFTAYYDDSNWVALRNYLTTGLEIRWVAQGNVYSVYAASIISASTAYYIEFSYGATADDFALYLNGVAQSATKTVVSGSLSGMASTPTDGHIAVGPHTYSCADATFDQLIISTDTTRDINAIKTVTDFN